MWCMYDGVCHVLYMHHVYLVCVGYMYVVNPCMYVKYDIGGRCVVCVYICGVMGYNRQVCGMLCMYV